MKQSTGVLEQNTIKLTNNSKVRFHKNHYNTFSLTQGPPKLGGSCPGATEGSGGCVEVCYDCNLRKLYKAYARVEDRNFELVKGKKREEIFPILDKTVDDWKKTHGSSKPYFRLHTGRVIYDEEYTHAWACTIGKLKDVRFWCYTRSLFALPILADLDNLTLYLSCDPVNKSKVLEVYEKYKDYKNIAIAWMGNDTPELDRNTLVCPEVTKKLRNTKEVGACSRCRACIDRPLKNGYMRHIQFPIHR
jgi:hypothetical protein